MRESKITVVVIAGVVVLLVLYLFIYQVRVTEVAIHYRPPGKVHRVLNRGEEDQSGLYFRLPWPIDKIVKYDRRVRVLDGPLPQTQLKDDWQVMISMYGAWRLADPVAFEESLAGNVGEAERRLKDVIFNETSKAIAKRSFYDIVSTDEDRLQFDEIEAEISAGVREAIEQKGYGIELVGFGLRRIAIPRTTTEEVFKRMKAEREAVAERYRSEGLREQKEIVAEAERRAMDVLADAESEAKRIRSEGEAEEAKYYDRFAEQPELAIFLRRLDSLRSIAGKARESGNVITWVLDLRTEPFASLYQGPQGEEGEFRFAKEGLEVAGEPAKRESPVLNPHSAAPDPESTEQPPEP